jgi:hypothetical protein
MSFEKAFINQFLRIILSPRYWEFSLMIWEKNVFTWGLGPIVGPKKHNRKITASVLSPFSELLPNLYYSPIKKLENIMACVVI